MWSLGCHLGHLLCRFYILRPSRLVERGYKKCQVTGRSYVSVGRRRLRLTNRIIKHTCKIFAQLFSSSSCNSIGDQVILCGIFTGQAKGHQCCGRSGVNNPKATLISFVVIFRRGQEFNKGRHWLGHLLR